MKKSTTAAGVVPGTIVEEAWQQVGASFERFCLTAGIARLAGMMEGDAARLCGVRYGRDDGKEGYRWGRTKGKLGFHGGKIELERPRVRARDGGEISLPSWDTAMAEDWLGKWALNLMLINVSTRKFGRAMRLPEGDVPAANGAGLSKSAASRRFVALSAERMKEWMASDLSKLDLLVIQIDGIHIEEDLVLLAAVGVDGVGDKHPLAVIEGAADRARWRAFEAFRRERGEVLERNCLFLALREHFAKEDPSRADWQAWPEEYRDPASPAVARFAEENRDRLDFLMWLQWISDQQLGAAAATAAERGMAVGLYRDLAVGADRAGAETWTNAAAVVSGVQVGAPPDIYNPSGQNWGLPPFHPRALREEGYRSFIELVRANMRHARGLRIDHAMGLQHLYWVPQGQEPSAGAYVRYPMEELIGILALESHRQGCLIVGEDLGTVPEGFRECIAKANILSYRVLFFEQEAETGAFVPASAYPKLSLAIVGSHDLPTLRGWWVERDLDLKEQLGLFPEPGEAARQHQTRERDRMQLLRLLRGEGLLPPDGEPDIPALARAAHAFLSRTPSVLAMVQIDDLTDEADPVNVPATSDEHPNWRRRLSMTLEELATRPRFIDIAEIFRAERGTGNSGKTNDHV